MIGTKITLWAHQKVYTHKSVYTARSANAPLSATFKRRCGEAETPIADLPRLILESPRAYPPAPIKRRDSETKLIFEETKWGKRNAKLSGTVAAVAPASDVTLRDELHWPSSYRHSLALGSAKSTPDACFCYLRGVTRHDPLGPYSHGRSLLFSSHLSAMVTFKMFRSTAASDDFRSSDEKALVRRLDIFLMTFGCLSQGALGCRSHRRLKLTFGSH